MGKDDPSDNIILRNLDFEARDDGDRILLSFWSSRQVWIDHINFNNTISYNRKGDGSDGVGKFIWINTPYANKPDGKDIDRSPDYITVSYCKFTNKFWCFAYGTQNTETTRDRTTLLYNWWNQNVRRCPQLGNGTMHIYNNYYQAYGQKDNGGSTTGMIGGEGSETLSQNNMFNGYSKDRAINLDSKNPPARDDNSYISTDLNGKPEKYNYSPKTKSSWEPNKTNYGYRLIEGYNNNNTDTKTFCTKYTGCFNSQNDIKYITDSDFSKWIKTTYSSPFLKHIDFKDNSNSNTDTDNSGGSENSVIFKNGSVFKIKNLNSGKYLQIKDGVAENGAKIQQWGTLDGTVHDIWKIFDAGKGYYYLVSGVEDGGTFVLDITGKSKESGISLEINEFKGETSQQFYISDNSDNSDGSYVIKTKISENNLAVEVKDAGKGSGDIIQQGTINGHNCQKWIFELIENPGCVMNYKKIYEFENVNSKLVMDITDGKMKENTNVQQSTSSNISSQQFTLNPFSGEGNYYYIHSVKDDGYALKVVSKSNGGNICISPYSDSDDPMLFKFSKNPDGTFIIMTKVSKNNYYVEVDKGNKSNGANIQQGEVNNHLCQNWKLNEVDKDKVLQSLSVVKTEVYDSEECIHTVIFVK